MSIHEDKPQLLGKSSEQQNAIDYGFDFARHWFHGQLVALLAGRVSEQMLKEVEEIFK